MMVTILAVMLGLMLMWTLVAVVVVTVVGGRGSGRVCDILVGGYNDGCGRCHVDRSRR